MAQPDIPGLVQRLRKLIVTSKTKRILESGEGVTRSALVDPMLRELGWDTADPTMVWPEYPLDSGGKVDYALLVDDKPRIFLEVKRLGDNLVGASEQVIKYCRESSAARKERVQFLVVTNGDRWSLYKSPGRKSKSLTQVATFSVRSTEHKELKEQASWLLRSKAGKLKGVRRDQEPKSDWRTLETWSGAGGEHRPSVMKFPDGSLFPVRHREYIVLNTVKWLEQKGLLKDLLPFSVKGSARKATRRFLVAERPVHESGKPMAKYERVGKYYVDMRECRYGLGPVDNARNLLESAGVQPSTVKIEYT